MLHLLLDSLLDLACPRHCPGCGRRGQLLCRTCSDAVFGRPFAADPTPRPAWLPPVIAAAAYDGPVRSAVIAFKERGRVALAAPLGAALGNAVAATGATVIVAVPSSRAGRRARGYDHVGMLARRAAVLTGAVLVGGLEQRRRVADQSGLDAAGRAANIAGSMVFAGDVRRCRAARVVLVDDIITSGATLAEGARALQDAGVDPAAVAVVAATARRTRLYKPPVSR